MKPLKPLKQIIGGIIKQQRMARKLTQQQLADLLVVDRQYVWRLENGKINLTMDYLDNIIVCLDSKQADFICLKK